MRRVVAIFAALAALAAPAAGQSLQEAARANVALTARLCMQVMLDRTPAQQLFGAAGFGYRAIDRGTNDHGVDLGTHHYFEAPAETAKAKVDDPAASGTSCTLYTGALPEAEVRHLIQSVIAQAYPQAQVTPGNELAVRNLSDLPLLISPRTITRHRYEPEGTVEVFFGFPG